MKNKEILEISKKAKIDRLIMLYVDLTDELGRIDKIKCQLDKNTTEYIFKSGIERGYYESLIRIEEHLKELGAFK